MYLGTTCQQRAESSPYGLILHLFLKHDSRPSVSIGFTSVDSIYTNPKSVLPFRHFLITLPQATQHFCLRCTALCRNCKDYLKYLGGCVYVHSVPWYKRLEHLFGHSSNPPGVTKDAHVFLDLMWCGARGLVISLRLPVSYPVCLLWRERLHT